MIDLVTDLAESEIAVISAVAPFYLSREESSMPSERPVPLVSQRQRWRKVPEPSISWCASQLPGGLALPATGPGQT